MDRAPLPLLAFVDEVLNVGVAVLDFANDRFGAIGAVVEDDCEPDAITEVVDLRRNGFGEAIRFVVCRYHQLDIGLQRCSQHGVDVGPRRPFAVVGLPRA